MDENVTVQEDCTLLFKQSGFLSQKVQGSSHYPPSFSVNGKSEVSITYNIKFLSHFIFGNNIESLSLSV